MDGEFLVVSKNDVLSPMCICWIFRSYEIERSENCNLSKWVKIKIKSTVSISSGAVEKDSQVTHLIREREGSPDFEGRCSPSPSKKTFPRF
jgi:hypothetical protein